MMVLTDGMSHFAPLAWQAISEIALFANGIRSRPYPVPTQKPISFILSPASLRTLSMTSVAPATGSNVDLVTAKPKTFVLFSMTALVVSDPISHPAVIMPFSSLLT